MQVSLKSQDGLKRTLKVVIPADRLDKTYQKRIAKIAKTAKIDGFRPGKVPEKVIKERFGDSVRYEAVDEIVRETLFQALQDQKLNPAGMPSVDDLKAELGKDVEYVASFEVYPDINLKDLSKEKVEKTTAEVTAKDIDTVIKKLRTQRADWIDVDRAAKDGDQVTIDFDGHIKKEAIEGGKANKAPVILGSNTMIPGFEEGIVGMKKEEEKEINVTFPKEYHEKKLAGQKATFKIKLHKVAEPKLPELNDDFFKNFGVKEGGLDAFRAKLEKHMSTELHSALKLRNKQTVLNKFAEINKVDLPKALIEAELEQLHNQMHANEHQGHDHEHHHHALSDEERKHLEPMAIERVKLGLLLNEAIKKYEVKPDAARVRGLITDMATNYDNPDEFVKWYYTDKKRVAQVEAVSLEDQVVDKLLESAKVIEKPLAYEEAIKPPQTSVA